MSGLAACPEEPHIKEKSASSPEYDVPVTFGSATGHRPRLVPSRRTERNESSCPSVPARSRTRVMAACAHAVSISYTSLPGAGLGGEQTSRRPDGLNLTENCGIPRITSYRAHHQMHGLMAPIAKMATMNRRGFRSNRAEGRARRTDIPSPLRPVLRNSTPTCHSTMSRRYFPGVPPENSFDVGAPLCRYENSNRC